MESEGTGKNEDTFIIRCASSLDDLQWVIKMATEEGFTPRTKEAECYFLAGLAPYFYIGELNGKRIGCSSLVKHDDSVAVGSYYIVEKDYRESGYGKRIFDYSMNAAGQHNIQTFSLMFLKDHHEKRGLKPGWRVKTYEFTAFHAVEGLASCKVPPSVEILPASHGDFEKMLAYGADMMGISQTCRLLLAAWLAHLQESSWVAIDNKGAVVGYLIMSETIRFPEEGYYIAPFYADSAPIGRSLLKVAAEYAHASSPKHIFYMDIPVDDNPEGAGILENEVGGTATYEYLFMANKGIPSKCLSKIFSFASLQVLNS